MFGRVLSFVCVLLHYPRYLYRVVRTTTKNGWNLAKIDRLGAIIRSRRPKQSIKDICDDISKSKHIRLEKQLLELDNFPVDENVNECECRTTCGF